MGHGSLWNRGIERLKSLVVICESIEGISFVSKVISSGRDVQIGERIETRRTLPGTILSYSTAVIGNDCCN